jgi:6-phosphofructokinase 1
MDQFVNDVEDVHNLIGRCVVAVSEGIVDQEGTLWAEKVSILGKDEFGHTALGEGAGALADYLANTLRSKAKNIQRVRADTYGYLQRSFPECCSAVDAWEARLAGQMAVNYSQDAGRDGSVALVRLPGTTYRVGTKLVGLTEVAPDEPPFIKILPSDYINEAGNNVDNGFREYVGPLVGDLPKVGWFEQIG